MATKRRPAPPPVKATLVTSPWALTGQKVLWAFGLAGASWVLLSVFIGNQKIAAYLVAFVVLCGFLSFYALWRKEHLGQLAAAGMSNPGIWKLHRDIAKAQRRRMTVLGLWNRVVENQPKLQGKVNGTATAAQIKNVGLTADGNVAFEVDMSRIGKEVDDFRRVSEQVRSVLKGKQIVVKEKGVGTASVVVQYTDPLDTALMFHDLPTPTAYGNVVIGVTSTGQPFEFPFAYPTLIGGAQGSGKSNAIWDAIGSLIMQGLWVKLYVIDPKGGMELGFLAEHLGEWMGRVKIESFATSKTDGLAVIKHAANDLDIRTKDLAKGGSRKLSETSQAMPLMILLIDEMLDYADELKKAGSPIQTYTRKARAGLATTWGLVQYAHAEELGTGRKLFGNRICFRAEDETGETLLGKGAAARGALTSKIPKSTPGVGWAIDETGELVRFRAGYVPDKVARGLALGVLPAGMGDSRRAPEPEHACYSIFGWLHQGGDLCRTRRCTCPDDVCLYVGETNDWSRRQHEHEVEKAKFGDVDWWVDVNWKHPLTRVEWKTSYKVAKRRESELIKKYGPLYNQKENEANVLRKEWKKGRVLPIRPRQTVLGAPELEDVIDAEVDEDTGWVNPRDEWDQPEFDITPPADPVAAYAGGR